MAEARDITERKRSMQALQDSEEKYRILVESAAEGICVIQDGLLKFVNNSLAASTMLTADEMTDKPFLDYVHPEDRELLVERESRRIQGETFENSYQFRAVNKAGQTRWLNLVAVLITWEDKPATLNFLVDITERKQAEDLLIRSEERFRLAINATDEGLWEWNIQTNTEFFAPRWCEIIGYSFDDPELPHTFQAWASRIHPDDHDRVMSAMNNHLEKGSPYDIDYRHQHKSGEYRWQNSKGKAVFAKNGKPTKMVGCISDIT
jgi:PAS domain S-box-containing protein